MLSARGGPLRLRPPALPQRPLALVLRRGVFSAPPPPEPPPAAPPAPPPAAGTLYDTLRVKPTASGAEVRQAYLARAKELHPDANPGDPEGSAERFLAVQAAYQTLADPAKRAKYDREVFPASQNRCPRKYQPLETDPLYWKARWDRESAADREKRRERYRKFARCAHMTDVVHVPWLLRTAWRRHIIASVIPAVLGAAFIYFMDFGRHEQHTDNEVEAEDLWSIKYCDAYLNPLTREWCRMPDGMHPPTPKEFLAYFTQLHGWKKIDVAEFPKSALAVLRMPRTQTCRAQLYRDPNTGHLMREDPARPGSYHAFSLASGRTAELVAEQTGIFRLSPRGKEGAVYYPRSRMPEAAAQQV